MDPDGLDLLLKEEPGSPAGMDFDALLMPQVLDRCGVCHQPCPPEEAKSLASCLRCSSKVHGRCDRRAADALKAATYLAIKNEPVGAAGQQQQLQLVLHGQQQQQAAAGYLCPTCVQQAADACPLDLLQLHAALLADIKPRRPRSAADIHAAELTRKHLAAGGRLDMTLLQGLIGHAWAHEGHKGRYNALADKEDAAYQASLATYDGLYQQYASLAASMGQEADISLSLDPQQHLAEMRAALTAAAAAAGGGGGGGGGRGGRVSADGGDAPYLPGGGSGTGSGRGGRVARVNLAVGDVTYLLGSGGTVTARDGSEVPQMINVTCNGTRGVFHLGDMKITCLCPSCAHAPAGKRIYTPTQFEQHGGCGTAKKWRISIRIEPGAVPEVARYANAMTFGRWMEMKGIEAKGQRTPASTTGMLNAYADGPHPAGRYGSIKSEREWSYDRGGSPTSSGRGEEGAVRPPSAANILPRNRRPESWAPWEDVKLGNYKPVQVRWAGDRCCVCDSDVDYDCDQLVSCEGCGVTVHQSCYGVPELPDEDDMWLCRSCELKEPGAPEPQCCLCPLTGGGLKPTTLKGMWAHAACMQWIPEVTCLEPLRMEPIDRIQYIQKERWELLCVICRQRMGAKIQCHECYQAYHPLCARRAGLHMEMAEPAVPNGPLQLITYCPKHCKARVGASGITLVNEEEAPRIGRPRKVGDATAAAADAAANNSASGLLNAQPFRPNKPAAPVPAAPGGCARATPLSPDDTQRVSHGTGTGATTVAGFWIPTTASAAAAAASRGGWGGAAAAGGGWYVLPDDDAQYTGGGRGRKRGRPPGRPPRPAKPPVYRASGGLPPADQPPPEVELLPLPADCPDRVMVQCNSRRGMFIVRSQRVEDGTRGGTELTPSRFEAVSGKAEAKKWRSSLWAVGEDGTPDCQMGDWLARFKLDKAALAKFTANLNAWQLRQLWEAEYTGEGAAARAAARAAAGAGVEGADAAEPTGTEGGTDAGGGTEGGEEEEEVQQAPPTKRLRRQDSEGPAGTEEADDGEEEGSEEQQGSTGKAAAAAAGEDDAAGPASKKQKRGASADANGNSPAAAAAAAADDAKQQEGGEAAAAAAGADAQAGSGGSARSTPVTKLKRLHLLHLPLGFRVHPAALPPRAAAAAAARQKQLLQQQQEKAAADAAAAAGAAAAAAEAAAGEGSAAAAAGSSGAPAAPSAAVPGSSSGTVTDPLMAAVLAPKTADSAVSAVRNPWLCVGQCCRVFWVDDDEWYDADVTAYDPASKKHSIWYHADEIRESIDLRTEEQQGRLQWLPLVDKSQWPAPPLRHFVRPQQQQGPQQQGAGAAAGAGPAGDQQQQQQQGPPPEPIPPGFPRLTAMHRDPSPAGGDSERADLVGLSARRAPLSQQLQAMLMLQQENHKRFSTQQPPRHLIPTGQAAVGWRVGLFRPEVGVYYYGVVSSHDQGQQLHMVNFDDGAVEVVPLQKQRIDWVSEQGADISAAAQALHRAYLQSRGEVLPPAAAAAAGSTAAAVPGGQLLSAGAAGGGQQQPQQLSGPPPDAPKQVDVICGPNQAVFDCVRMAVLTSEGLLISPTEFERQSGKGCSKKWKATIRVRKANGFPGMTMGDWLLQMGYEQPRAGGADGSAAAAAAGGRSSSLNDIRRRQFSRRAMGGPAGGSGREGVGPPDREDKPYQPKGTAPNRGTTSHRPNCMCVICKQARRKAAQAAGVPYVEGDAAPLPAAAPEAAAAAAPPAAALAPAGKGSAAAAAAAAAGGGGFKVPAWLIGKRAYVRAVPHHVRGATWHNLWEVPESTCYTAAEWEAAQAAEDPSSAQAAAAAAAAAAAGAAGSSRPGTPAPSAGAGPDTSRASTPVLGDSGAAAAGGGAAAAGGDGDVTLTDTAAAAAAGAESDQQQQGAAAAGAGAAAAAAPGQQQQLAVKGSRSTTWRSKLRVCQTLEPRRITFGKSGIHGWGIFARRPIPADTMVTEFRGQLIRGILADVREAEYRKQHRDCYMFHATAGTVIDNTECGNTSRFTNHCCSPCLYVKVLELQGELHLCFFAKRDIAAGQELTFDYRFKEEDSDSKVLCQCAAPNCKGTLN